MMDVPAVGVHSANFDRFGTTKFGDVGYDLYVHIVKENQSWFDRVLSWLMKTPVVLLIPIIGQKTISSGIRLAMPPNVWCEVRPRSSTSRKMLDVLGGTIDSGYMGEMYTVIHNHGFIPRLIVTGQRYAQVVFHYAVRPHIHLMDGLEFDNMVQRAEDVGGRAATGFGSTGA